ncbi:MAG: hypothetical protein ACR2H1_02500 [Limisphaerales bacterium]
MNEKLQSLLHKLCEKSGQLYGERLLKMILFGSQARGEPTVPSSEIFGAKVFSYDTVTAEQSREVIQHGEKFFALTKEKIL